MLNSYLVQRLKGVHDAERFAVLLCDGEPTAPIGCVGRLVYARFDFLLDDCADFVVYARWYRDVAFDPRDVLEDGELDRGEVLGLELTALGVFPGKRVVVD